MKKRLSKIARDLKSNVSLVVEFLRANGYDCDEDPNESVPNEVAEIIHDNFPAFITEKNKHKHPSKEKKVTTPESSVIEQIPVELRIIEAARK